MAAGDHGPVEIPPELAEALGADPAVRAAFDRLPPSHRREYADWIEEAKREKTRRRRAEQAVAMVRDGLRRA